MILKRLILLGLTCCLCLGAFADDKDYTITADNITVEKGTQTSVLNFYMTNVETICNIQFDVYLPKGVEVYYGENEDEDMVYFVNKGDRAKASHTASVYKFSDGVYRVLISSVNNSDFKETEENRVKPVVTMTLDVSDEAASGAQTIEIKNIVLSHYNSSSVSSTLHYPADATATLNVKGDEPSVLLGDANGDGSVTITDALAIVYKVLNKSIDNFVEEAADVNQDGDITITDALSVVKMVLGGNSAQAKEINEKLMNMLDPQ